MTGTAWIEIAEADRALLLAGLDAIVQSSAEPSNRIQTLRELISKAKGCPDITIGVYGGQVQWVTGNPFPLEIIDYDGEPEDFEDTDDYGHKCRRWHEPPEQLPREALQR